MRASWLSLRMERRSFLALIASAPIAALAPWPTILERTIYYAPYAGHRIAIYNGDDGWSEGILKPGDTITFQSSTYRLK